MVLLKTRDRKIARLYYYYDCSSCNESPHHQLLQLTLGLSTTTTAAKRPSAVARGRGDGGDGLSRPEPQSRKGRGQEQMWTTVWWPIIDSAPSWCKYDTSNIGTILEKMHHHQFFTRKFFIHFLLCIADTHRCCWAAAGFLFLAFSPGIQEVQKCLVF